jgi:hypothetical protein
LSKSGLKVMLSALDVKPPNATLKRAVKPRRRKERRKQADFGGLMNSFDCLNRSIASSMWS